MADSLAAQPAASLGSGELADCCRWIADAHDLDDPQQEAQALAELFRHLAQRGWIAPPAASLLLRLQDAAVQAEVAECVSLIHLRADGRG